MKREKGKVTCIIKLYFDDLVITENNNEIKKGNFLKFNFNKPIKIYTESVTSKANIENDEINTKLYH